MTGIVEMPEAVTKALQMTDRKDAPLVREDYHSAPSFVNEAEIGYRPTPPVTSSWPEIAQWRKTERARLIEERLAMTAAERAERTEAIAAGLDRAVGKASGRIISTYWPFRGEPDLRNWSIRAIERGGRIALPVVIRKGWPLEFRIWKPGDPLERGIWNILVPSRGPAVEPDIVIAPVVGFDAENYRLGYGGGFFDRTLAAMRKRPFVVGVGYAAAKIDTIHPQPHDIAMSTIVTDQ